MPLRDPRKPLFSGGIQLPVQASGTGGLALVEGDDYIMQLIRTNMDDCENDNPFQQDLGIAVPNLFQNMEETAWKARMRKRTDDLFRRLRRDNLAVLKSVSFKPAEDEEGAVVMTIRFRSIETNTEHDLDLSFR
jgi:hypothetical protein